MKRNVLFLFMVICFFGNAFSDGTSSRSIQYKSPSSAKYPESSLVKPTKESERIEKKNEVQLNEKKSESVFNEESENRAERKVSSDVIEISAAEKEKSPVKKAEQSSDNHRFKDGYPEKGIAKPSLITRTIEVSGSGAVSSKTTLVKLDMAIETKNEVAIAAVKENAEKTKNVFSALKSIGVSDDDIITSNFSMNQESKYINGEFISTGFKVTNSICVTIRKPEKTGEVIDSAINAGANKLSRVFYEIEDKEALVKKARILAMKNAREKASLLAEQENMILGSVIEISEGASGSYALGGTVEMEKEVSTVIATNDQTVSALVKIKYELIPKNR